MIMRNWLRWSWGLGTTCCLHTGSPGRPVWFGLRSGGLRPRGEDGVNPSLRAGGGDRSCPSSRGGARKGHVLPPLPCVLFRPRGPDGVLPPALLHPRFNADLTWKHPPQTPPEVMSHLGACHVDTTVDIMGPSLVGEGSDCSHWTWALFWIWIFSPACTGTFLIYLLKALFAVPVPHVSLFLAKDLTLQSKKQGNGRCPWASRGPPRTLLLKGGDPEGWRPSLGHGLGPRPGDSAVTLTLCPAGHASQQCLFP